MHESVAGKNLFEALNSRKILSRSMGPRAALGVPLSDSTDQISVACMFAFVLVLHAIMALPRACLAHLPACFLLVAINVVAHAPAKGAQQAVVAAANERVVLAIIGRPYHGTSAMQAFIGAGRGSTTLCGMRLPSDRGVPGGGKAVWQCEASKALVEATTLNIVGREGPSTNAALVAELQQYAIGNLTLKGGTIPIHATTTPAFPGLQCTGTSDACVVRGTVGSRTILLATTIQPMRRRLEFFGRHWNLSHPILTAKDFKRWDIRLQFSARHV